MPTTTWDHWLYVGAGFFIYVVCVMALFAFGDHGEERNPVKIFFLSISSTLERITGYPGWSMAGVLSGLNVLGVAMVGVYWDVAFHIDHGRDQNLLTPSHTMIVLGLGGLVYAAVIAVLYASLERADTQLRVGPVRIPWSALVLGALGTGGLAGFPLDALWHDAFGVDVTLWSPTHLTLLGGGGLAPIALALMLAEARGRAEPTPLGRVIEALVFGAVLTGLSAFQGEFDFGVPQFQVLYLPVLVAVAAGFTLVLARLALGAGGALKAVAIFLVLRTSVALLVGGALNHTVPRFPLYLAAALAVEGAAWWLGTERRLRFAAVAGALVSTVGLAGEAAWIAALDWFPVSAAVVPKAVVLGTLAAVAAAVLAAGMSGAGRPTTRVAPGAVVAGLAVLLGSLAYPLPRQVGDVQAVVRLQPDGSLARVEVELQPPDAAERATAFGVVSWQGGGRVQAPLEEVAPGRYVSSRPVPVTGTWKSMVGLQRGDQVMAAPIYLPADEEIGAPEIPALAERRTPFVRNTDLLLRETHDGPGWAAVVGYGGLATMLAVWLALFALCSSRIGRQDDEAAPQSPPDRMEGDAARAGAPPPSPRAPVRWAPDRVGSAG